jgi:predicted nucleic acid-binding protein
LNLTIDSFAWIEVIRGTRRGAVARARIEEADACYTPAIGLAEVARRCHRDGLGEGATRRELIAMAEASTIVPIDPELAVAAANAIEELVRYAHARQLPRPGLSDGLVLATARKSRSRLLTGDRHFQDLTETDWLD